MPVKIYKAGDTFKAGPFEIEAVHVTHSIPEPVSLAISSPLGKVIHTGDWKIDTAPTLGANTDEKVFRGLGEEGILALICNSTNAMREGDSPTETDGFQFNRQGYRTCKGQGGDHNLLFKCRTYPLDCQGCRKCRATGDADGPLNEARL